MLGILGAFSFAPCSCHILKAGLYSVPQSGVRYSAITGQVIKNTRTESAADKERAAQREKLLKFYNESY